MYLEKVDPLPLEGLLPRILASLERNPRLILKASPGAGKTTGLPPALLSAAWLTPPHTRILLLQPRRVAARASAERLAEILETPLGRGRVGYHIRFEKKYSSETQLIVLTEGMLARWIQNWPTLEGVGAVIFDEFHERNIHSDVGLALVKEIQESLRPDLRIIVMSATLESRGLATYLGECPVVESQGRLHALDVAYQPRKMVWSDLRGLEEDVLKAVERLLGDPADDGGDILVFLPGWREIQNCWQRLAPWAHARAMEVLPLHGRLSAEEQRVALRPLSAASGMQRKIILSTNVAETSLTIPGVSAVIDSGLARNLVFGGVFGLSRLELQRISLASAQQRAGRAGRERPGRVVRLWSSSQEAGLRAVDTPEIRRMDLSNVRLQLGDWGVRDVLRFDWFEAPSSAAWEQAEVLLKRLGALSDEGVVTLVGRAMLRCPVNVRWARVLVGAYQSGNSNWKDRACEWAARASEDPRKAEVEHQLKEQMNAWGKSAVALEAQTFSTWEELLLVGFSDRVARRRSIDSSEGVMVGGRGVRFGKPAELEREELFICLEVEEEKSREGVLQIRAQSLVPLPESMLARFFPKVHPEEQHRQELRQRLDEILQSPRSFFEEEEASRMWLTRHDLYREHILQKVEETLDLRSLLESWVSGLSSLKELNQLDRVQMLESSLSFEEKRAFDRQAPEYLEVPSGRKHRLRYEHTRPAIVLSVRIQEVFGWKSSPCLLGGKIPVTLELLGPHFRPIQITDDLASFWTRGYGEVRKELRARYPKHRWPEDPWNAVAEAKGHARKK